MQSHSYNFFQQNEFFFPPGAQAQLPARESRETPQRNENFRSVWVGFRKNKCSDRTEAMVLSWKKGSLDGILGRIYSYEGGDALAQGAQ